MSSRHKIDFGKTRRASCSASNPSNGTEQRSPSNRVNHQGDGSSAGNSKYTTETASTNLRGKSRGRFTGPLTRDGKARSSLNATKHQIFSKRTFPEEVKRARVLYQGYEEYFRLEGVPECEIGAEMVLNRIEKFRIEQYALGEFMRARMNSCGSQLEKLDALGLFRPEISVDGTPNASCFKPTPRLAATLLGGLKQVIETRGLRCGEDLEFLKCVYGEQVGGKVIPFLIRLVGLYQQKDAKKRAKPEHGKFMALLLDVVESEAKAQQILATEDEERGRREYALGMVALPPDHVLDKISHYRATNAREFRRLLEGLVTIRRLQGN